MEIKNEKKITIAMVASLCALGLLIVYLVSMTIYGNNSIVGTAIGPSTLDSPICVWQVGSPQRMQLISDADFCNRLFLRYGSSGQCRYEPNALNIDDRKMGNVNFVYEGYCSQTSGSNTFIIYSGHVE